MERDENEKGKSHMDKEKGKHNGENLMSTHCLFMEKHFNANIEKPQTKPPLCEFTFHPGPWIAAWTVMGFHETAASSLIFSEYHQFRCK